MKRDTREAITLFLAFWLPIILAFDIPCSADVIYVDDNAALGGDGSRWGNAYRFLQDAIGIRFNTDILCLLHTGKGKLK